MPIRILAIGKKHEPWVQEGIARYESRLRKPFELTWALRPHATGEYTVARKEESTRLLLAIREDDFVVLLDEQGELVASPVLSKRLLQPLEQSRSVVIIIGGAYGVDERVHKRANFVWSLSPLVFPHQLVRLLLVEQVYRAQEIAAGKSYHHE